MSKNNTTSIDPGFHSYFMGLPVNPSYYCCPTRPRPLVKIIPGPQFNPIIILFFAEFSVIAP